MPLTQFGQKLDLGPCFIQVFNCNSHEIIHLSVVSIIQYNTEDVYSALHIIKYLRHQIPGIRWNQF